MNFEGDADKTMKHRAASLLKTLKAEGYERAQIVALAAEVLGLVSTSIKTTSNER